MTNSSDSSASNLTELAAAHTGVNYRTPTDLRQTELSVNRILFIGSCLALDWLKVIKDRFNINYDYILTNNFSPLPDTPPNPFSDYDFSVIQIPLRSVFHENTYSHLDYQNLESYEALFAHSRNWIINYLDILLAWNQAHGQLTFVTNFFVPQQSPLGRLVARNDLRNMTHFVERLNGVLYEEIGKRKNVYLLDFDQIAASIGRQRLQDDSVFTLSHGALLNDGGSQLDQKRIQPLSPMSEHYPGILEASGVFYEMAWLELVGMHRTIRQVDMVKLVVVDLDDTLWRGVVAENEEGVFDHETFEGWPIGLMETLCFLRKRGILLAIASKNDEARILELWDRLVGGRLRLRDFAVKKINWRSKVENLREILSHVNVTARSVVFIDDNPVERAAMKAAFPEIRVLGAHPYYLRRILLWSPETQVSQITEESSRRTEMVQAQIVRETQRESMSHEDFLKSLELRIRITEIRSVDDKRFPRSLELINKTNQFNTTGRRWSLESGAEFFSNGGVFEAMEVEDKFSNYGLVAVALVKAYHIEQFVMSCRVLGMEAEAALLGRIAEQAVVAGVGEITAEVAPTDLNILARDLYKNAGFVGEEGRWRAEPGAIRRPPPYIKFFS
jgi:FkbH-like protein